MPLSMRQPVLAAFWHCRVAMLSIFTTYLVAAFIGGLMAHTGSPLALGERDRVVNQARATDPATLQLKAGNRANAALLDFVANVVRGAIPQTLLGLAVVPAYVSVGYQGWIGGIVSVDDKYRSRLAAPAPAIYFVLTLLLQIVAYSATIGAGVQTGIDLFSANASVGWQIWKYKVPKRVAMTLLYVYLAALPVFLVASTVEYLWPFSR